MSLAPSVTESLFAIGAGAQVVGVTTYCNFPPAAAALPRVGGIVNPNIETIVHLAPDLIIVSMEGNTREDFRTLTGAGIPVFVTNPRTLEGIHASLHQLGVLSGHERTADSLTMSMKERERAAIGSAAGRSVRVLMLVSLQPLIAVGTRTFLGQLLSLAGGDNLAAATGMTYPPMSREAVLAADPEVILITSDLLQHGRDVTALFPEWGRLRAIRSHRVIAVDPDLVSRPGPRAVDGLELLSSSIHNTTP